MGFTPPAVVLGLVLVVAPLAADAQQPPTTRPRIGWLDPGFPGPPPRFEFQAFQEGVRQLGYVEGQNIVIDPRWAEEEVERLAGLADELVRSRVDVLVTRGNNAARAAKQASPTVPIVFVYGTDPVAAGLVASLARPGGNMTGLTLILDEAEAKRLEVLKEAVPTLSRVAVLRNPATTPLTAPFSREFEEAARALRVELKVVASRAGDELAGAFSTMIRERAQAAMIAGAIFFDHRRRIADLAMKHRLPTMHEGKEWVEAGGLVSYGASIPAVFQRAATFVDKILKGAKPAELPVERPAKFELVINLKTARALGLTIPQSVPASADHVIP